MISGPTNPHPRTILQALLESGSEAGATPTIESGLRLLERDVRVGEDLRVDFLARDAVGTPVLLVAVDADDESWAPLQLADLQLWFQENAYLLEQAVSDREATQGLTWTDGFRIIVVALDVPPRFYRRLELLRGIDLDVYELRSVFVRGETRWFLRGVAPWVSIEEASLATVPTGLADPELSELAGRLLERATSLDSGIEIRGDRYERELRFQGQSLLSLEVRNDGLRARLPHSGDVLCVRTQGDVERVLDSCLRAILAQPLRSMSSDVSADRAVAIGRDCRTSMQPITRGHFGPRIVTGPRLSEAEVSAICGSPISEAPLGAASGTHPTTSG